MKWADLLGPLFPSDAAVDLEPQLGEISIRWVNRGGAADGTAAERNVAIRIAPNAIKDYRNAQGGQQARADRKLFALVHSCLKRHAHAETPSPGPALDIEVASGDILSR